jgi:outer membrane receptor protein involved in Fe transport
MLFNREVYSALLRFDEDADSLRLGSMHRLAPRHTLLSSLVYQDVASGAVTEATSSARSEERGYSADVQHVYDSGGWRIQSGLIGARQDLEVELAFSLPGIPPLVSEQRVLRQLALYTYAHFNPLPSLTLTAGISLDRVDSPSTSDDAANPKIGLIWRATPSTTVRAAVFETLFDSLTTSPQNAQPRLEPAQIAGFTQLLLGASGDTATVRGLAIEQELASNLFVGWEASTRTTRRTVETPLEPTSAALLNLSERAQQAYFYWLPSADISVAAHYERSRYRSEQAQLFGYTSMKTARLPIEVRYFTRSGFSFGARASYIDQEGEFQTELQQLGAPPPAFAYGEDRFWVLDAFVGYRLANRRGLLSLNADNLLDETFQFQDVDPTNPSLFPERLVSVRFTLAF